MDMEGSSLAILCELVEENARAKEFGVRRSMRKWLIMIFMHLDNTFKQGATIVLHVFLLIRIHGFCALNL